MNISRRSVLKGALAAVAAGSAGSTALGVRSDALLVFDSRLRQSREFATTHAGPLIDLAREHATLWRQLRGLRTRGSVIGLTRWSDFVQVRSLLAERGSRLRAQARCGRLFYWELA